MFPVVKILWTDATVINDWKTKADLANDEKEDTAPCTSIGFLIKTTKQFYYVANTVTSGETEDEILSNGIILIPRKWVVSKQELHIEG